MKKIIVSLFVICFCVFTSFSNLYALDYYDTFCPQPSETEHNGWIAVLCEKSTGARYVHVYTWSNQPTDSDQYSSSTSFVDINIFDHSVVFNAYCNQSAQFTIFRYATSVLVIQKSIAYSNDYTATTAAYSDTVVGFMAGGNVGKVVSNISINNGFEINWGTNVSDQDIDLIISQLLDMGVSLENIQGTEEEIYNKLVQFYNAFVINQNISDSTNANNELGSVVDEYDGLEQDFNNNLNSSLNDLDTDISLFGVSDFVKTGNFVSTQLTNIFNSNQTIQNMTIFSLVVGFSLVLIGIGVRR